MTNLVLAVLAFVGGHFLLSSPPVRGPLAGRMGETVFSGLYSALMLAAFLWMVAAFRAAPYVPLWSVPPAARMIPVLVMPFACLLLVGSLTVRNPTMVMQSVAASGDPAPGMIKVTRHPMLWAFGLWALAHLLVNGEVAALLLFGGIAVLALGGTLAIDGKRRMRDPDGFARLATKTSNLPLAALIAGRATMRFADIGWWRLGLAALLYVAFIIVHPLISGRTLM
ncbi:MAG: NnrU family protein [Alphaproteobacteria bacterium]|nr:NnrU family protein [Alphaproteobacteria bacterium]